MALYKRGNLYWISIYHNGARIQRSTGTCDRKQALELHDNFKAQLWRETQLGDRPKYTWMEATLRWLRESAHKRSLRDDKVHLRWLAPHFKQLALDAITRDRIEKIANIKSQTGVTNASVNRLLALIRSILNKAANEWEWIDRAPKISMRVEDNHRVRWLSRIEASTLISELPQHLADMASFTLATGLRQSNVKKLQWNNLDLEKRHAWIHAEDAKGNTAIAVPLNDDAMTILKRLQGIHPLYVFTFKGNPVTQVSTRAWRNALQRAGIKNFRWHDLRHTWASWHIQNGTSLQELQALGSWANFEMVLRYAHLSSEHLRKAAERVSVTNSLQCTDQQSDEYARVV